MENTRYDFGPYGWRVLEAKQGKTLLLSENVLFEIPYFSEDDRKCTWETSDIRKWLNGEFFRSFPDYDRARIAEAQNENPGNDWYGISGGNPTADRIFLLSVGEVVKHFGDSGALHARPETRWMFDGKSFAVDDAYNAARMATFNGTPSRWWLRTPGLDGHFPLAIDADGNFDGYVCSATYVFGDGAIDLCGIDTRSNLGIRPALWLADE